jgi:hypothetical protein
MDPTGDATVNRFFDPAVFTAAAIFHHEMGEGRLPHTSEETRWSGI